MEFVVEPATRPDHTRHTCGCWRRDTACVGQVVDLAPAVDGTTIAERVLAFLTRPLSAYDQQLFPWLSTRGNARFSTLMAAGRPNGDIARQLLISPKRVRNNVSSIFAKLQVADRAHAIIRARSAGLGSGDS
jgi:hypothetical protein